MELDNKYIFFHFYSDIKYQFLIWAVIQTNQVSEKDNRGIVSTNQKIRFKFYLHYPLVNETHILNIFARRLEGRMVAE